MDVRVSDSLLSNIRKGSPAGDISVLVQVAVATTGCHSLIHHLIVGDPHGSVTEVSKLDFPVRTNLHVRLRLWPLLLDHIRCVNVANGREIISI